MRLENKVALITGAGSGIGRGIARRFAAEGALLVLSDLAEEGLHETSALINEALVIDHPERNSPVTNGAMRSTWGTFVIGDVSVRADAERMVEAAITRWERLDIVVNNAGISGSRQATLAHTTPDEEWERVMAVNVNGVFRVASAAIKQMLGQGSGAIVNIASAAGFVPFPGRAAYNMHHREDLYPDPFAFRPERWLNRKPGTYEWIPFGGGIRRCLGAALAMAEQRVVLEAMARRLDLEAEDLAPERAVHRNVTMIPARGASVIVRARQR